MPGIIVENAATTLAAQAAAQAKTRVRRKVSPAPEASKAAPDFVPADVFYSFRGFANALAYWMPKGLNESVTTARSFRQIVR